MYELLKEQLKEFEESMPDMVTSTRVDPRALDEYKVKDFIKSHTIQLLEKEIKRLESKKVPVRCLRHDFVSTCDFSYNQCIADQISHLKAEINKIKEL